MTEIIDLADHQPIASAPEPSGLFAAAGIVEAFAAALNEHATATRGALDRRAEEAFVYAGLLRRFAQTYATERERS